VSGETITVSFGAFTVVLQADSPGGQRVARAVLESMSEPERRTDEVRDDASA